MTLDFAIVDWLINNLGSSGPISARLPRLHLSHPTAPPKSSSPLTPPARSAAHHPPHILLFLLVFSKRSPSPTALRPRCNVNSAGAGRGLRRFCWRLYPQRFEVCLPLVVTKPKVETNGFFLPGPRGTQDLPTPCSWLSYTDFVLL